MLQIVAALIDAARGIIYDHHMFIVQATGAYTIGFHYKGGHSALPANKRLGWKWLTLRDTPAYYDTKLITAIKSFIVQTQVLWILDT